VARGWAHPPPPPARARPLSPAAAARPSPAFQSAHGPPRGVTGAPCAALHDGRGRPAPPRAPPLLLRCASPRASAHWRPQAARSLAPLCCQPGTSRLGRPGRPQWARLPWMDGCGRRGPARPHLVNPSQPIWMVARGARRLRFHCFARACVPKHESERVAPASMRARAHAPPREAREPGARRAPRRRGPRPAPASGLSGPRHDSGTRRPTPRRAPGPRAGPKPDVI
jgi:hypothetical protein